MGIVEIMTVFVLPTLMVGMSVYLKRKDDKRYADIPIIKKDLVEVKTTVTNIAIHFSAEERITQVAIAAQENIKTDDMAIMKFIKACVDVSVFFYKEITNGDMRLKTEKDIEKYSNMAIGIIAKSNRCFDQDFIDIYWPEFERKAIGVREDLLNVINGKMNDRKDGLIVVIVKYLRDQLSTVVDQRNDYLKEKSIRNDYLKS